MDRTTLGAYDRDAAAFADDWEAQPTPVDMHDVVRRFFRPGPTADIGCGAGRDTAWLDVNGYSACGYDASQGLLQEARRRHPHLRFLPAVLPRLEGIADESFVNVLCETVIMHLEPGDVTPAVARLLEILAPGGTLYLSWRVTQGKDRRDEHGRLYAAFDPVLVQAALGATEILLDEERGSLSSGKVIRRVAARKARF
ncbi:MAG: class I SAM-dependent methyltransferase [Alphaproteobacteria bacterium]|nr:class I SAM-dependent methyltransferase [Alphaproteobacteria bacterium]